MRRNEGDGDREEKVDEEEGDDGRGRRANSPSAIPAAGWKDIAVRLKREISDDRVSFTSAGVAFYFLLALVPAISAIVMVYGLWADAGAINSLVRDLSGVVPPAALDLIEEELQRITSETSVAGWGAALSIALAIWGASKAIDALVIALNVAYDERETRGFFHLKFTVLGLTTGFGLFLILVAVLLVVTPFAMSVVGLGSALEGFLGFLRWPLIFVAASIAIAAFYRFAPSRAKPKWRWITWGSLLATLIWVGGSALFSWYATSFGDYSKTYGSLGAVILLLFWFYLTGFAIILGAEINAEIEHQTKVDTTTGEPAPLGERGAFVADDVGKRA